MIIDLDKLNACLPLQGSDGEGESFVSVSDLQKALSLAKVQPNQSRFIDDAVIDSMIICLNDIRRCEDCFYYRRKHCSVKMQEDALDVLLKQREEILRLKGKITT